jgi:hypothetical protein
VFAHENYSIAGVLQPMAIAIRSVSELTSNILIFGLEIRCLFQSGKEARWEQEQTRSAGENLSAKVTYPDMFRRPG